LAFHEGLLLHGIRLFGAIRNEHAEKCYNENSASRFSFEEEGIIQVLKFFPVAYLRFSVSWDITVHCLIML
jgi:hypothetical protein